ncbi:MAG TPA: glucoamylase family protein [Vicinamibacteria bacterium]|nr:glucoamylase family protein [Vicinamibacteria bacterium]
MKGQSGKRQRGKRRPKRKRTLPEERLSALETGTFDYFWQETNPGNGLLPDSTRKGAPASIAGVGLALASYAIGAARGYVSRSEACNRVLKILRFFARSPQGVEVDATGYKGFYYHFLDVESGRRHRRSELSTIDTAILLGGFLTASAYFDRDSRAERETRALSKDLVDRVDWKWAQNGGVTVSHGWSPERGFLPYRWEGYNEALLLHVIGLGSETSPLPRDTYRAWCSSYVWKKLYGIEFLYGGPLFMHQLSHAFVDFRGIQDEYMRAKGIDYFENSRRATYVQQQYAIRNPKGFEGYGEHVWGITASDGPGPLSRRVNGVARRFLGYRARAVPWGPDDGTLAPWAVAASLPFAPEIVLPTLDHYVKRYPRMVSRYGLVCSFNPTLPDGSRSWISGGHFAIDQGPVAMMIENYRSGLIWRLLRRSPVIVRGLRRAGFAGGWLGPPK